MALRARQMADWLLTLQFANGAFPGGLYQPSSELSPVVFNTGQILQGLGRAYVETRDPKYLASAKRAGDWLIQVQDDSGAWSKYEYGDAPHAYHTRVAWPLLQLWQITQDECLLESAKRNLDWACTQQKDNGWFESAGFLAMGPVHTHTICYTIQGLFESALILKEEKYFDALIRATEPLMRRYEISHCLPAEFDMLWRPTANYICVTGQAQLAEILFKLFSYYKDYRYLNTALKMTDDLCHWQIRNSRWQDLHGAVRGSKPYWGDYLTNAFPNWAAKFFLDALYQRHKILVLLDVEDKIADI
jgi:rhamnogalacturonyl hydrolase YesR